MTFFSSETMPSAIVFGIITSIFFIVFLCLALQLLYKTQKKDDIKAPRPQQSAVWNDTATRESKSRWARMDERMENVEQHRPSRWERRTFPGGRVVVDGRSLPGTNHTVRCKPLPGRLEPRIFDDDTTDTDTKSMENKYAYFVGQEPSMKTQQTRFAQRFPEDTDFESAEIKVLEMV